MALLTRGLQLPDFLLHAIAFACLSLPAFLLFRPMVKAALGVFAIGAGLELAQWLMRVGEVSLVDLVANTVGIGLAALFVLLLKRCDFAILRPLLGNPS